MVTLWFREALKQILSRTTDLVVAAEASNSQEVIDKIGKNGLDLVVLDIAMPGRSGLEIERYKESKT